MKIEILLDQVLILGRSSPMVRRKRIGDFLAKLGLDSGFKNKNGL